MKGVLMLLVIAGHAMELAGAHSLILWIGSGFRMPLMLGISGYLLNISRVRSSGLRDFLSRYGKRLLVPWGVAVIIYAAVSGWHLSPSLFLELVLRPPFHLWYVPVLFFLISATWALPVPPLLLLALGTPFSLIIMYMFGLSHGPVFMDYGRQIAVSSATPSISSLACWLRKISCRAAISPVPC